MPLGTFSAIPVAETTVGIAKETSRGTAVAPTLFLPTQGGPKYQPNMQMLEDKSLQGSMAATYDVVPGLRYDGFGFDMLPYLDTIPALFEAELGSTDTLVTAPTSTTLSTAATVGATTLSTAASIAAGSWITLGSGLGSIETHLTTSVTGAGPYTVTLATPVQYAHASGIAVTGLTGHRFSLLNNSPATGNQPPSFTITEFGGETAWRQLTAAQLNGLTFSGAADSLPKLTADFFTNPSQQPTTPTPSFSGVETPPGWTLVTLIGGTQVSYVETWEIDLGRGLTPVPAITGTQNYFQYFADVLTSTAKLTVLEDVNSTWLSAFESGTTESLDMTLYDVKSGFAINLHSSLAKFTSAQVDRSKQWVEVPLEVQLLPNTTDALAGGKSPIVINVGNATTTQY